MPAMQGSSSKSGSVTRSLPFSLTLSTPTWRRAAPDSVRNADTDCSPNT